MTTVYLSMDSSGVPTQRSDDFTYTFTRPIVLKADVNKKQRYKMALIQANLWYSWFNIDTDAGYDNHQIRYYSANSSSWVDITYPDGNYDIYALADYLHAIMSANGDSDLTDPSNEAFYIDIIPNFTTLRCDIKIATGWQLDISIGNFSKLIGFDPAILNADATGQRTPDITRGVNQLNINCSLVTETYINGQMGNLLWTFRPETFSGAAINVNPPVLIYVPLKEISQITEMRIWITDQLSRPVDLNGEPFSVQLFIMEA